MQIKGLRKSQAIDLDRGYIEIAALLVRQERRLGACQSKKAAHVTGGQLQCLRIVY